MKSRPYYFEIKNLITQFMAAFNDIAIKRFDENRVDSGESIGVGFTYSPKPRVIEDILNKSRNIPLPTISVSIASIARDPERVFNKIDGHIINTTPDADIMRKIPQPVPINLTVNMSIIARYQADIEQIISNFVPYCDPYITISWKLPTTENTTYEREMRTIIEWSGTLNMQYPVELSSNQLARVTCDTTFTIKGWLFKQIDTDTKKIYNILASYNTSDLGDGCLVFNNTEDIAAKYKFGTTENFTNMARPTLCNIDYTTYFINATPATFIYTLYGKDLINIKNMYISADVASRLNSPTVYDIFRGTIREADNPPFFGVELKTFTVTSSNTITFSIPSNVIVTPGKFDIVVKNAAGYSLLSRDSVVPTPSFTTIAPLQPQCTSGMVALF